MSCQIRYTISSVNEIPKDYLTELNVWFVKTFKELNVKKEKSLKDSLFLETEKIKISIDVKSYPKIGNYLLEVTLHYDSKRIEDKLLEKIKFDLKGYMMTTISECRCHWISDSQIEKYSFELYKEFHRLENKVRAFINEIMIKHKGIDWWEQNLKKELKEKVDGNIKDLEEIQEFKNVEKVIFGLTTTDIFEILRIKLKKLEVKTDTCHLIEKVCRQLKNKKLKDEKEDDIMSLIKNTMDSLKLSIEIHDNFWENYFSIYLGELFNGKWKNFINHRNLLMHNKPLTLAVSNKIIKNIEEIDELINIGKEKLKNDRPSLEEEKEFQLEVLEFEMLEKYKKEELKKDRIYSETGIYISNERIESIFIDFMESNIERIEGIFNYREDLEVRENIYGNPLIEIESLCKETNKNKLIIEVLNRDIDTEYGEMSTITIGVKLNKDVKLKFDIRIKNATYEFNEYQATYLPTSTTEIETSEEEVQYFLEELEKLSDDYFETPQEQIDAFKLSLDETIYNPSPVLEEECPECGNSTISMNERFNKKGLCITCGTEHELYECYRCERIMLENTIFCEDCDSYIEKQ